MLPVAPPPLPPYLGQVGGNRYKRKNAWRFDDLFASLLSWDLFCLDLCWFVCLNYSNWLGLDVILTCMFELLSWADFLVPGPWHGALNFGAMWQCFPPKKSTNRRQRIGEKMTIHQFSSISSPEANIAPLPRLKDGGWKLIPSFLRPGHFSGECTVLLRCTSNMSLESAVKAGGTNSKTAKSTHSTSFKVKIERSII